MLSKTQQTLLALFAVIEQNVETPYFERFQGSNPEFLSDNEVINVRELNGFLIEAGIIERGSEIPYIKKDGVTIESITPDIIASAIPTKAKHNSGTTMLLNGKMVDEATYERDLALKKLKNAMTKTKEKMAANAFLLGKYKQANSNSYIDYEYKAATQVDAGDVKNWIVFFFDLIEKYEEEKGVLPTRIELGKTLFEKIIKNQEFLEIAKSYSNSIGLSSEKTSIFLSLLGQKISKIRTTSDFDGAVINVDNYIYLSNDQALVSGYAALEAVDEKGTPISVKTTEILDTVPANKETAQGKIFAKSAFAPIIAIPSLIVRYEITNTDAILIGTTTEKGTSGLDAVVDYYLAMSVSDMTSAISTLVDIDLLNLMLDKETRTSGKTAIQNRITALA